MASPTLAQLQDQIQDTEACAERASTSDEALEANLKAAELCLRALELTPGKDQKKRIDRKCRTLLDNAERIKSSRYSTPGGHPSVNEPSAPSTLTKSLQLKVPRSSRQLTTREQIILLEGSKLHGAVFPPWQSPPSSSEFKPLEGQPRYIDGFHFKFSDLQLEVFNGWQHRNEILAQLDSDSAWERQNSRRKTVCRGRVDLVQDITTDCSVVASLCAGTASSERGHPEIFASILYPPDEIFMEPSVPPNGKYIVKLHFNGCDRKITIDDRLPCSKTTRFLHVIDRNNPYLFWPALVEKAYLKVRGGYDLPGSNSGTDLWILTGWIPEQLFLQSEEVDRAALWVKIRRAFDYGDLMITTGTGRLTEIEEESMGLVGEHDYAVLDLKEHRGRRLLLVKNPWSKATVWKGSLAYAQPVNDQKSAKTAEITAVNPVEPLELMPGTFWMDINDVFQSFESMYLNWNPALFSRRGDTHFTWDLATARGPSGSFWSNPQFQIRNSAACVVWLLLSRHFKSQHFESKSERSDLNNDDHGFISIYAYRTGGEKVLISDDAVVRGPYVDSPNTLLKLELPTAATHTIVVSEQTLPPLRFNFTLSALSNQQLIFQEARETYEHRILQRGAWTLSSAGGNASTSTYLTNPSFAFELEAVSDVALLLEAEDEQLSVHVKLVWASGRSVNAITTRDVVGDSGEYGRGYALAVPKSVDPGAYTIVCSTFDPGQLGRFRLNVGTTKPCKLTRVLPATAGRLVSKIEDAIFTDGNDRLRAPIFLTRITRLRLLAWWHQNTVMTTQGSHSPVKIGLEYGQGPSKSILATSGDDEFLDGHRGIETHDVNLQPRMCQWKGLWIIVERLGSSALPQCAESLEVEIASDAPIEVGAWAAESD